MKPFKPSTDAKILNELKKQAWRASTDPQESPNSKRREKVIYLMQQGYTYEKALEKTNKKKKGIFDFLKFYKQNDDPYFTDIPCNYLQRCLS